jgi:hypothetical protein
MRIVFLFLLIFTTKIFAQNYTRVETPFNSFIKSPTVLWSINADDTIRFGKPKLADLLVKKIRQGKIKASGYIEEDSKEENNIRYLSIDEIGGLVYGTELTHPIWGPDGNIAPESIKRRPPPDTLISKIYLRQKFFIKYNKLQSYISYVFPMKTFITSQGINLGDGQLFAVAFNKKYDASTSSKDKVISLGVTNKVIYVDSVEKDNKLKETFGRNLIETLWPAMEGNKITLYTTDKNKRTTIKQIDKENLLNLQSVSVPVHDNNGEALSPRIIMTEITPSLFNKITITQQWYYNETKNIVFCKIPNAILSIPKFNEADNATHEIKIVF